MKKTDSKTTGAKTSATMSAKTGVKGAPKASVRTSTKTDKTPLYLDVIIAGFGGQGVLLMGNLLACAGMEAGLHSTFIPVYGAEMRGGTANCTVVLSKEEIGSPLIKTPKSLIIMNQPSFEKFVPHLDPKGICLVNTSLVSTNLADTNLVPKDFASASTMQGTSSATIQSSIPTSSKTLGASNPSFSTLDASEKCDTLGTSGISGGASGISGGQTFVGINTIAITEQLGNPKLANMVALGAYLKVTQILPLASAKKALVHVISSHYAHLLPLNKQALEMGYRAV